MSRVTIKSEILRWARERADRSGKSLRDTIYLCRQRQAFGGEV